MTTYHGSCHCKALRYEIELDLSKGTGKCNCSYCWKVRNWSAGTKPEKLRWIEKSTLGEYGFRPASKNHHLFCTRCGVRIGTQGDIPETGGPYVSVQLSTLDDLPVDALMSAPLRYMNGRDDDWFHEPAEHRHL
jgi:hypothetical protein